MNISGPTWDAAFYYSYARSLVFDQDLSLANDLQLSYTVASPDFVARQMHADLTVTGQTYAPFAIGSGLLWTPLVALIRLVARFLPSSTPTGFEWFFIGPVATFSALTGLVAFAVAYHIAAREVNRKAALLATLAICFATPLIYYQFREPLYAHVPSALLNTLFVALWLRSYRRIPSMGEGLALGALLGLAALMRWQNVIYVVLPLVSTVWAWSVLEPSERRVSLRQAFAFFLAMGGSSLFVFTPQLVVWQAHYGSWLTIPQGDEFMSWSRPFLREILFSPFRGLLPWMPVFGLACLGLLLAARKRPRLAWPMLLLVVLTVYINASSRDWFAGGGYGPRRFAGELAIVVLGYSWLIDALPARLRVGAGTLAGILLIAHQWLLLRFALAERIGGRVVSMAPAFEWSESTLPEFARQLAAHIPSLFNVREVFVFPLSPLDRLLATGRLPLQHLASLLIALLFLGVCMLLLGAARRR